MTPAKKGPSGVEGALARKCLTPGCVYTTQIRAGWMSVSVAMPNRRADHIDGLLGHLCLPQNSVTPSKYGPLGVLYENVLHDAIEPAVAAIQRANAAYQAVMGNIGGADGPLRDAAYEAARAALTSAPASPEQATLAGLAKFLADFAEADLDDIAADGGVTVGMVFQQQARTVFGPRLTALADARAHSSPPSSEGASSRDEPDYKALALTAERERDEALKECADLTKALTGLTRQGSEFFVRKGDRFTADIPACIADVRRRYEAEHAHVLSALRTGDKERARALSSEAREKEMVEALEASRGIEPLLIELGDCLDEERPALMRQYRAIEKQVKSALKSAKRARTVLTKHRMGDGE